MVIRIVISFLSIMTSIYLGYRCKLLMTKTEIDNSRYSIVKKGVVTDYVKRRHSLDHSKRHRILYHPVVKYKVGTEEHESTSEVGYNREYFKVGKSVTIYCDVLNQDKIKTKDDNSKQIIVCYYVMFIVLLMLLSIVVLFVGGS